LQKTVGIVVPTLGTRPDLLTECLTSIRTAGSAHICVIAPAGVKFDHLRSAGLIDQIVDDPMKGLATAINTAFRELPEEIVYINWLGDDDVLVPESIQNAQTALEDEDADFVFGRCTYIDLSGEVIGRNKSGSWAMWLLQYGPDLVPQPGSLFRRSAFEDVGGLNEELGWVFDLDLFLKFRESVSWHYLPIELAKYRWHEDTLSTGSRKKMIQEAQQARKNYLSPLQRRISLLWELPTASAVNFAGSVVSSYSRLKNKFRARRL
jgi:hypothetical protein